MMASQLPPRPGQLPLYVRKCAQCKRSLDLTSEFESKDGTRFVVVCEKCRERDAKRNTRAGLGLTSTQHTENIQEMRVHLRVVTDYPADVQRPRTRGDCADGPRPCPWVSCKHHLMLDITDAGSLKYNFDDLESMTTSCALDVAEQGGATLEDVSRAMNLTRERSRQIEELALRKLGARRGLDAWREQDAERVTGNRVHEHRNNQHTNQAPEPAEEPESERDESLPAFHEYGGDERWASRVYRAYLEDSIGHGFHVRKGHIKDDER